MTLALAQLGFAHEQAAGALDALAPAGSRARSATLSPVPARTEPEALERWMVAAAAERGVEAWPIALPLNEVEAFVRSGVPALVSLEKAGAPPRWLVLAGAHKGRIRLASGERDALVDKDALELFVEELIAPPLPGEVERLLASEPREKRRAQARRKLRRELSAQVAAGPAFLIRPLAGASFGAQLRRAGLVPRMAALLVVYALLQAASVGAFWLLGRTALQGRPLGDLFSLWAILLGAALPLQLFASWLSDGASIWASALLKRRMLAGVLALEPDATRSEGLGGLLGRVLESNELENMSVLGAFKTALGATQLVAAILVLLAGAGAALTLPLLAAFLLVAALLVRRYSSRALDWTQARLRLAIELFEQMAGYRTRLAQLARAQWHTGEDQRLRDYLRILEASDASAIAPLSTAPRALLLLLLCAMVPSLLEPQPRLSLLAVALGGALLAEQAVGTLFAGLIPLSVARIAWRTAAPIFRAAERLEQATPAASLILPPAGRAQRGEPLLEVQKLSFRYPSQAQPVLAGVDLSMRAGDRVLLEGPSGGGKSTLAAVLSGLRPSGGGLLALRGLDLGTLGATEWRRRVAAAPQFHENHIFSSSLAFNVLMGRRWPPAAADWTELDEVCAALGLAPLIARMPGGSLQWIGDSGWQLSHGEQSRIFIARALVQRKDLVVLDESFASLDPETLAKALRAVVQRAETLLVIAHP